MSHLRRTARRKEIAEGFVVPRLRQISFNRKAAVRLFLWMDVLEALEILAHDEQVKRHVVQDVELLDLFLSRGMKDCELKLNFLPGFRRGGHRLDSDNVF